MHFLVYLITTHETIDLQFVEIIFSHLGKIQHLCNIWLLSNVITHKVKVCVQFWLCRNLQCSNAEYNVIGIVWIINTFTQGWIWRFFFIYSLCRLTVILSLAIRFGSIETTLRIRTIENGALLPAIVCIKFTTLSRFYL